MSRFNILIIIEHHKTVIDDMNERLIHVLNFIKTYQIRNRVNICVSQKNGATHKIERKKKALTAYLQCRMETNSIIIKSERASFINFRMPTDFKQINTLLIFFDKYSSSKMFENKWVNNLFAWMIEGCAKLCALPQCWICCYWRCFK